MTEGTLTNLPAAVESWLDKGKALGILYSLSAVAAIVIGVVCNQWLQKWCPWGRYTVAAAFSLSPPIYFALEYWRLDLALDKDLKNAPKDKKSALQASGKAILDSRKAYQDAFSKIWLAVAAAIVFLYVAGFDNSPKKLTCTRPTQNQFTCVIGR